VRETSAQPVQVAIRQHIQALLASPEYGPGDRIPSERALAEELGSNRITVRKAIDALVAQGLLERDGTSGTRVARTQVARPLEPQAGSGIARVVEAGGAKSGSKLLHFEQANATARVAERLSLIEGAQVVIARRLLTVNDAPFCVETSHIPAALVPGLAAEDLMAGQSLYALLRERYRVDPASHERTIQATAPRALEQQLLGLRRNEAALIMRLVVFDAAGRPIEYLRSVNHPQLVVFRTAKAPLG
jgi:GntR family transcriptional regulator